MDPDQSQDRIEAADAFLAACLRAGRTGDAAPPLTEAAGDAALLRARALHHGIHGLLCDRPALLPPAALEAIRPEALAFAMWDLRHRSLLVPLLRDFASAGIVAVLLKGTAFAHGIYPAPGLRPRGDTDLLIAPDMRAQAARVLRAHGFRPGAAHAAERMPQEEWERVHDDGSHHAIDLHWNLLRPWALSGLFDTRELLAQAVPLPRLSPGALSLPPPLALLHACVHRASHFSGAYFVGQEVQYGGDRLIWFEDMRRLAEGLTDPEWTAFADRAAASGTSDLCLDAMHRAQLLLDAPFPAAIRIRLEQGTAEGRAAAYFAHSSLFGRIRADMAALPAGQSRAGYLRELVFPPSAVMRAAFPAMAGRPLILLYLLRFRERWRRLRKERLFRKGRAS